MLCIFCALKLIGVYSHGLIFLVSKLLLLITVPTRIRAISHRELELAYCIKVKRTKRDEEIK